jgi:hypothetical protein
LVTARRETLSRLRDPTLSVNAFRLPSPEGDKPDGHPKGAKPSEIPLRHGRNHPNSVRPRGFCPRWIRAHCAWTPAPQVRRRTLFNKRKRIKGLSPLRRCHALVSPVARHTCASNTRCGLAVMLRARVPGPGRILKHVKGVRVSLILQLAG